jgi:hypothetical protein
MPRKPNYSFEKRQKELDRKARKENKLQRRQERQSETDDAPAPEGGAVDEQAQGS